MRISIIQMRVESGEVEKNLERFMSMLEEVKDGQVAVAPELALTGYVRDYRSLTGRVKSAVHELSGAARDKGIYIIIGMPLYADEGIYNAAFVFGKDGNLIHVYRKIHLFPPFGEQKTFKQGNVPAIFSIDGIRTGLNICYDLRFPELSRYLAMEGAIVIFNISMWPEKRYFHQYLLSRARALENQVFFLTCNATGGKFSGRSHAFRPDGEVLFEAPAEEGVFTVDVDVELAKRWRDEFPSISQVRKDINWWKWSIK